MPYVLQFFYCLILFRLIYCSINYQKGFGDEEPTLQGRLEEFFSQYGVVNAVRMRRDEHKKFKVCHFVYMYQSITTFFLLLELCFHRIP